MRRRFPPIWPWPARPALLAAIFACAWASDGSPARAQDDASPAAAAVALVTDTDGPVRLRRQGRERALAVLETLAAGDRLQLPARAHVELAFTGGDARVYRLDGPGRFAVAADRVSGLDPGSRVDSRDLLGAWRELRLQPGMVGRASVSLRGAGDAPIVARAPVGAQLAARLGPLRWDPPYGRRRAGWTYALQVIDAQGRVVLAATTAQTGAPLPADLPWVRESLYAWTISARADDGRRAEASAQFHLVSVVAEERVRALEDAADRADAGAAAGGASTERVLLALVLEQYGLRDEAERQWRRLAPGRPALGARVAESFSPAAPAAP
jgi:hypothetical protein